MESRWGAGERMLGVVGPNRRTATFRSFRREGIINTLSLPAVTPIGVRVMDIGVASTAPRSGRGTSPFASGVAPRGAPWGA